MANLYILEPLTGSNSMWKVLDIYLNRTTEDHKYVSLYRIATRKKSIDWVVQEAGSEWLKMHAR